MPKKLSAAVLLLVIVMAASAYAQDASPPFPNRAEAGSAADHSVAAPAKIVKAILVKSWGDNPVWANLNTNWSTYGKTPVSIDHTTLISSDFTYQDLVNSKANVIILSNPAGGTHQYSPAEFAAIAKYAKKGHAILGTYLTFKNGSIDNRRLAPVFGLRPKIDYSYTGISNAFKKDAPHACLLKKISGSSWQSNGFSYSQVPLSGSWRKNLGKAKAVADSDTFVGMISLYTTKAYTGIYVSNMPEYKNVGGDDEQLLYNALTCYVKK